MKEQNPTPKSLFVSFSPFFRWGLWFFFFRKETPCGCFWRMKGEGEGREGDPQNVVNKVKKRKKKRKLFFVVHCFGEGKERRDHVVLSVSVSALFFFVFICVKER